MNTNANTESRTPRSPGALARLLGVGAVAALALSGCSGGGERDGSDRPAPSADALVVAPDGGGDRCTADAPCALSDALGNAIGGSTVQLTDGDYGEIAIEAVGTLASAAENVVVEAAPEATPSIAGVKSNAPNLTWRGLGVDGVFYLDDAADGTTLEEVHVRGHGVFIHAADVIITGSTIEGGSSVDGIQFSGASNVLVEDSIIRNYDQTADNDVHADCVQIFDSTDLVLRGNYIGNCHNASIIFSPGSGDGISNVLLEENHIQGCVVKNELCGNGTLIDLRETSASDVVVRSNTMIDGSVLVEELPGLVFDSNVIDYVSNCDMPMTNTIVARWNAGLCDEPKAIGSDGNRVAEVEVVDREAGDLRLADPAEAKLEGDNGTAGAG